MESSKEATLIYDGQCRRRDRRHLSWLRCQSHRHFLRCGREERRGLGETPLFRALCGSHAPENEIKKDGATVVIENGKIRRSKKRKLLSKFLVEAYTLVKETNEANRSCNMHKY